MRKMRSKENGEHNICPHHNKLETIQVGCAEDEAGAAVAEAARSPGQGSLKVPKMEFFIKAHI